MHVSGAPTQMHRVCLTFLRKPEEYIGHPTPSLPALLVYRISHYFWGSASGQQALEALIYLFFTVLELKACAAIHGFFFYMDDADLNLGLDFKLHNKFSSCWPRYLMNLCVLIHFWILLQLKGTTQMVLMLKAFP